MRCNVQYLVPIELTLDSLGNKPLEGLTFEGCRLRKSCQRKSIFIGVSLGVSTSDFLGGEGHIRIGWTMGQTEKYIRVSSSRTREIRSFYRFLLPPLMTISVIFHFGIETKEQFGKAVIFLTCVACPYILVGYFYVFNLVDVEIGNTLIRIINRNSDSIYLDKSKCTIKRYFDVVYLLRTSERKFWFISSSTIFEMHSKEELIENKMKQGD